MLAFFLSKIGRGVLLGCYCDKNKNMENKITHLKYEIKMFSYTAYSIGSFGDIELNNAVFESFLIHFRSLYEFLFCDKKRSDDINYTDFDSSNVWNRLGELSTYKNNYISEKLLERYRNSFR